MLLSCHPLPYKAPVPQQSCILKNPHPQESYPHQYSFCKNTDSTDESDPHILNPRTDRWCTPAPSNYPSRKSVRLPLHCVIPKYGLQSFPAPRQAEPPHGKHGYFHFLHVQSQRHGISHIRPHFCEAGKTGSCLPHVPVSDNFVPASAPDVSGNCISASSAGLASAPSA